MTATPTPRDCIAEIAQTRENLRANREFYERFVKEDLPGLGRKTAAAMVFSQIFTDFYTCVETLFLRISQFFENSLRSDTWHRDLLHKMTLAVEDVRVPVISDETHGMLAEILRFRHFRRYYFEMQYDWDRIELVERKYRQAGPALDKDLKRFVAFLKKLQREE